MAFDEIFHYFVELESFLSAPAYAANDINTLESLSRKLEDHISIISTFSELMTYPIGNQNVAQRRTWLILEELYGSLRDKLNEILFSWKLMRKTVVWTPFITERKTKVSI